MILKHNRNCYTPKSCGYFKNKYLVTVENIFSDEFTSHTSANFSSDTSSNFRTRPPTTVQLKFNL